MVWQTAERLDTYDIRRSPVDQLHHFSGEEPSFTGLVAQRNDRLRHFRQICDLGGRSEMFTLGKFFVCRASYKFDGGNSQISFFCKSFLKAQIIGLKVQIVEAVAHEVDQVRAHRLGPFFFQQFCQMIVGSRKEFYQDLSYNTHSRLLLICDRKCVKFPYHLPADPVKLGERSMSSGKEGLTSFLPFFMQGIGRTFYLLVGTHTVDTLHQDISEDCSVSQTDSKFWSDLKSRIFLQTA